MFLELIRKLINGYKLKKIENNEKEIEKIKNILAGEQLDIEYEIKEIEEDIVFDSIDDILLNSEVKEIWDFDKEIMLLFLLDENNKVNMMIKIFGNEDEVDLPVEVQDMLFKSDYKKLLSIHNHPGDISFIIPSRGDMVMYQSLINSLNLLGKEIYDFIIVGQSYQFHSLRYDAGLFY